TCTAAIDTMSAIEELSLDDFKVVFQKLETYGFDESNALNILNRAHSLRPQDSDLTLGEILRERARAKDETIAVYKKVGYEFTNEKVLPPSSWIEAYLKLMKLLITSSRKAGIKPEDILLPALVFERTNNNVKEKIFVTPGIDALPNINDGWKISPDANDLNAADFARMIELKKFALDQWMFYHDIGHLADFILRPQYMKAFRTFVLAAAAAERSKRPEQEVGYTKHFVANLRWIDRIMNEWIFVPRKENVSKIAQVIPGFDIKSGISEVSETELYAKYAKLGSEEIRSLAQKFVDNRYLLFSNHGGGARDNSTDRFIDAFTKQSNYGFGYRIEFRYSEEFLGPDKGVFEIQKLEIPDMAYFYDESPGIFYRLQRMLDTRYDYYDVTTAIEARQKQREPVTLNNVEALDEVIAQYLAKIEFRVRSALLNSVTPEGVASDITLLFGDRPESYFETSTYKYFSSYPVHSIQNYLFTKVMQKEAN
ncbi:MAG: hypothetical protein V4692_01085, partial [Bdellovibrionota bacterium]